LKPGIPYENRGLVALLLKGSVIGIIEGIIPLPELEVVDTIMVEVGDGWFGKAFVVTVVDGI
jgi:hypothetical protein